MDIGEPFVKATYVLEGDGLLVFRAYSVLQALSEVAGRRYDPNVDAIAKELSGSPAEKAELKKLAWGRSSAWYYILLAEVQRRALRCSSGL